MKNAIVILLMLLATKALIAQSFINGDLDGVISFAGILPDDWQAVPFTDPNCNATDTIGDTPDLTDIDGPFAAQGVMGNPYSGSTFVSGLNATSSDGNFHWHEGIQQSLSGLAPDTRYAIRFYQTVVKQDFSSVYDAIDTSGSWSVYFDNNLVGISAPSYSQLPYNSINLQWDLRVVEFVATSETHVIKFLPSDDDTVNIVQGQGGALRMGIDSISIVIAPTPPTGISENGKSKTLFIFPNPTEGSIEITSDKVYEKLTVDVLDLQGRVISTNSYAHSRQMSLQIDGPQGIYFLRIQINDDATVYRKIVKK